MIASPPPFTILPTRALADRQLLESDVRVLGAICSFWNRKTERCYPSHPAIAERSGRSVPTVKNALGRLKARGYIDWTHSTNTRGLQGTNDYYVLDFIAEAWLAIPEVSSSQLPQEYLAVANPRVSSGRHARDIQQVDRPGVATNRGQEQTSEQTTRTDNTNTAARKDRERTLEDLFGLRSPADDDLTVEEQERQRRAGGQCLRTHKPRPHVSPARAG